MSAFTWPPDRSAAHSVPLDSAEPVPAAVLVPIFRSTGQAALVLTRRRSDLRRHAGEISFPGGRADPADRDLAETALRETEEEIGLDRDRVTLLGRLPPTPTIATNYLIHPYVATIPAGLAWQISPREVDAVVELPLADVRAGRTVVPLQRRGLTFMTDAYVVGPHLIWGATARIIEHLLARLDAAQDGSGEDVVLLEPAQC